MLPDSGNVRRAATFPNRAAAWERLKPLCVMASVNLSTTPSAVAACNDGVGTSPGVSNARCSAGAPVGYST